MTVLPMALGFFYVSQRLKGRSEEFLSLDRRWKTSQVLNFFGIFTLAALARFEFPGEWVIAGWAALALAAMASACLIARRVFLA